MLFGRKWWVLALVMLASIPVALDATILHVALPTLSLSLEATGTQLLWIIDIYSLVMAGLLLAMGALGDRIGLKPLLMTGMAIFGLASLIAALAGSATQLILGRAMLAVGAAMIFPATLALVRHTFDNPKERALALGLWSSVGTAAAAAGPVIGGLLLARFDWSVLFLVNIPLTVLVLIASWRLLPSSPRRREQPWAPGEAILLVVSLMLVVYAGKTGLGGQSQPALALSAAAAGLAGMIIFVRRQLRSDRPLLNLSLLTRPPIAIGVIMAMTTMIAIVGYELLMVQELQFVLGYSPLQSGLFILPMAVGSAVSAPLAGWLLNRLSLKGLAGGGLALASVCFLCLAFTDLAGQRLVASIWLLGLGFGLGAAFLAASVSIMNAASKEEAGTVGGIESMAYELGAGLGVTIFGLWLSRLYADHLKLPAGLDHDIAETARKSIGEALQTLPSLDFNQAEALGSAARQAFSQSHQSILVGSAVLTAMLVALAVARVRNN